MLALKLNCSIVSHIRNPNSFTEKNWYSLGEYSKKIRLNFWWYYLSLTHLMQLVFLYIPRKSQKPPFLYPLKTLEKLFL